MINLLLANNKAFVFDLYGINALALILIVLMIAGIILYYCLKHNINVIEKVKDLFHSAIDLILKVIVYVFLLSFFLDKWHYFEKLLPMPIFVLLGVIVIILILSIISILLIDKLMDKYVN